MTLLLRRLSTGHNYSEQPVSAQQRLITLAFLHPSYHHNHNEAPHAICQESLTSAIHLPFKVSFGSLSNNPYAPLNLTFIHKNTAIFQCDMHVYDTGYSVDDQTAYSSLEDLVADLRESAFLPITLYHHRLLGTHPDCLRYTTPNVFSTASREADERTLTHDGDFYIRRAYAPANVNHTHTLVFRAPDGLHSFSMSLGPCMRKWANLRETQTPPSLDDVAPGILLLSTTIKVLKTNPYFRGVVTPKGTQSLANQEDLW